MYCSATRLSGITGIGFIDALVDLGYHASFVKPGFLRNI
jgi:hypothetical protein